MAELGKFNTLNITKQVAFGVYLDAGALGEVLLPLREVPAGSNVGDPVEVFLYTDSEDRPIATVKRPRAQRDQCVSLQVAQVNHSGAFLDWGLPKDLLVPFNEQRVPMREGLSYVVYVFLDKPSGRLAASSRLENWLSEDGSDFEPMEPVKLLICGRTDMGYKAVINQTHLGLIFKSEIIQPLRIGQKVPGYIRRVREEDGRIDLCLQLQGQAVRDDLSTKILEHLHDNEGRSALCDKSSPEDIYATYGVSKGNYKKTVGKLLKEGAVVVYPDHIVLASSTDTASVPPVAKTAARIKARATSRPRAKTEASSKVESNTSDSSSDSRSAPEATSSIWGKVKKK